MAIKTHAPGNGPNTGAPGFTPAPKSAPPAPADFVTNIRKPTGVGAYGTNGYAGASSLTPGQGGPLSPLAKNLKASSDDGQGALDDIINRGIRTDHLPSGLPDWQERPESDKQYPPAHGMRRRGGSDGSPG